MLRIASAKLILRMNQLISRCAASGMPNEKEVLRFAPNVTC